MSLQNQRIQLQHNECVAYPWDKEKGKNDCVGKQQPSSDDAISDILVHHIEGPNGDQRDAGDKGTVYGCSYVLGVVQGWDVDPPVLKGKEQPHPEVDGLEC